MQVDDLHLYLKCHCSAGVFQTFSWEKPTTWFLHKCNIGRKWVGMYIPIPYCLKKRIFSQSNRNSISLVVACCHSLLLAVIHCTTHCAIHCHLVSFAISLVATRCHLLSLAVPIIVTCCHLLSLIVTCCHWMYDPSVSACRRRAVVNAKMFWHYVEDFFEISCG